MATVPVGSGATVLPQGYQGQQVGASDPGSFGVGVGRALESTGSGFNQAAQVLQREDDTMAVDAATLKLRESIDALGKGEGGYYNQAGEFASYEARDAYLAEVAKLKKEIGSRLKPGRQVNEFGQIAGEYEVREKSDSAKHAADERKVYQAAIRAGEMKQSQNDVVAHYNNPEPYLKQIDAGVAKELRAMGVDTTSEEGKKALATAQLAAKSAAHGAAIDAMLDQNKPGKADAYLAKWGDQIDPVTLADKQRLVNEHGNLKAAQTAAHAMSGTDLNQKERIDALRAQGLDPEVLQAAEAIVKSDWSMEEDATTKQTNEYMSEIVAFMDANPNADHHQVKAAFPLQYDYLEKNSNASIRMIMGGMSDLVASDMGTKTMIMGMIANPRYSAQNVITEVEKQNKDGLINDRDAMDFMTQAIESMNLDRGPQQKPLDHFKTKLDRFAPEPAKKGGVAYEEWERKHNILNGMFNAKVKRWEQDPANQRMGGIPDEVSDQFAADVFYEYQRSFVNAPLLGPVGPSLMRVGAALGMVHSTIGVDDISADDMEATVKKLEDEGKPANTNNIIFRYMLDNDMFSDEELYKMGLLE